MSSGNKVPLQDPPAYHSGGDGGIYPSVPPPYPGGPSHPMGPPPPTMGPPPPTMGPSVMHTHVTPATVVTTSVGPAFIIAPAMGAEPCRVTCKSCHQQIITRVDRQPTMRTHLMALLLCVFGCWPCVCLPYCMDSCLNADHYCTNCNAYLGTYQS